MPTDIRTASDSFSRPADTTTYAAGDAISDSTSAPAVLEFENCAAKEGRGGVIQALRIVDSAYTAAGDPGALAGELWLFDTAPTALEDNSAADLSDAELANAVAVIAFDGDSDGHAGTATAGADGNLLISLEDLQTPFQCASGDRSLYGVLIARNAYVPVSGETFTVTLVIDREIR